MKSLPTLAQELRKPTKREAQEIIKEISELYGPDQRLMESLASLYNYFMPPIPKKPKTNWDWVASAAGTKDVRYYLNYVYVTEKEIIGTDGNNLHVNNNENNLDPGFYFTNGDKFENTEWARYPEFERIFKTRNLKVTSEIEIPKAPKIHEVSSEGMYYRLDLPTGPIYTHRERTEKLLHGFKDRILNTDGKYIWKEAEDNRAILLLLLTKGDIEGG